MPSITRNPMYLSNIDEKIQKGIEVLAEDMLISKCSLTANILDEYLTKQTRIKY